MMNEKIIDTPEKMRDGDLSTLVVLLGFLCLGLLGGCGRQERQYGNFVGDGTLGLVNDAAAQLVECYPPARTRFVMGLETRETDLFGVGMMGRIREAGYSVVEWQDVHADPTAAKVPGSMFTYLVDDVDGETRVSLFVGDDVLSRVYYTDDASGDFVPAGGWAWRRGDSFQSKGEK